MAFREEQSVPSAAGATTGPAPRIGTYFRPEDLAIDRWVHLAALLLCTVGVPVLLTMAGRSPSAAVFFACSAYAATLVWQFVCSTAFHHLPLRITRLRLRQFDHVAIYLLVAGTSTAFTATLLPGFSRVAITALVWLGALSGAIYKLVRPPQYRTFSITGYLLIASTSVVGLIPVLRVIDPITLILIVAGCSIYVVGAAIRLRRRSMRYRNTIWHMMVTTAAACHFAAILHGVVLA
jgi:hemolysin III